MQAGVSAADRRSGDDDVGRHSGDDDELDDVCGEAEFEDNNWELVEERPGVRGGL